MADKRHTYEFPKNFIWGTAMAAHQVEGNNTNSDWWYEENNKKPGQEYPIEPSKIACDFYNRYEEDFDLAKLLNNNAVRISLEWARIEPKDGEFSKTEVEHYRKVLHAAKKKGLKTFVTLHHFTLPLWAYQEGGFENTKIAFKFAKYAKFCAESFDDLIDHYITINEPQVLAYMAYTIKMWPPFVSNGFRSFMVQFNFLIAHINAYKAIKKVNKNANVGIVNNMVAYQSDSHLLDKIAARFLKLLNIEAYLYPLKLTGTLDFIGLNFYFSEKIKNFKVDNPNDVVSDLGWWVHPKGLEIVLRDLKKFNVPIYVTENGIADNKDDRRSKFIKDMLIAVSRAINHYKVDVRGYFYWSLIDNFEWHHGFWPRFGLVKIDRKNDLRREPRQSFYDYAQICKDNRVTQS